MKSKIIIRKIILIFLASGLLSSNSYKSPRYFFVSHLIPSMKYKKAQGYGFILKDSHKGKIKVIGKYLITHGMNGYSKRKIFDRKSPIGKYKVRRIVKIYNNQKITYGTWNLSLNYPHIWDKREGKTGSGIAIHGGRVSKTDGCIRVLDGSKKYPKPGYKNIAVFAKYSKIGTPVFISYDINPNMLGNVGTYLSTKASHRWRETLKYAYTEGGLVRRLRNY